MTLKVQKLSAALRAKLAQVNPPNAEHKIPGVLAFRPSALEDDTNELLIFGNIGDSWWDESVTAKEVVEALRENTASRILVRINSYGGSVTDGIAIYNELRAQARAGIKVDGRVESIAASIASLIAMACGTLEMPETSSMMLHAPWGGCWGNARDMREYADVLDGYGSAMSKGYARKSGRPASEFDALWKTGKDYYYSAEKAVEEGLADKVTEDDEADADAAGMAISTAVADATLQRLMARAPQSAITPLFAAARAGDIGAHLEAERIAARGQASAAAVKVHINANSNLQIDPALPPAAAQPTPADAGKTPGETAMTEEEKKAAAKAAADAALAADQARRGEIRAQFAPFRDRAGLDGTAIAKLQQECEDAHDVTAADASTKLLAMLGKDTTPSAGRRPGEGVSDDETKAFREGAANALLHRAAPSAHKLDDNARQFRGFDLNDLARACVERGGRSTRGMSKTEIAIMALQSTSDFGYIAGNVINRTLTRGYELAERTFSDWARQGSSLPNFKEVTRVSITGAPALKRVLEGADYEYGTIGDGAEKYAVQKYGRIVNITWEAIVNDDLDAFTRIPFAFGASAAELESDIVYAILTGNPKMADGKALFHADHGNLASPASALSDALDPTAVNPLALMRKAMRLQKSADGRHITVRPKYLLVPPSLEEVGLKATSASIVASKASDQNVIGPSMSLIVEPRLEDASATAFFGAADSANVDTVEFAYLQGHEGVFTETKSGFDADVFAVKCRHVFGAKALDSRGLYKNPGA